MILPADTPWLCDPKGQALCSVLTDAGHQALFVGGCVRNAILKEAASDVDIATDALPDQVASLMKKAGHQTVPTGVEHGTITVVVDGAPFEVTTFRRDVETDGRRAVVSFSKNIVDDARRRDFTMNALYAEPSGLVVDPLGGLDDAIARRVRFIEDAQTRIGEDYLRILRFFRFSAYYADLNEGFDADALSAIAASLGGLSHVSAERIGSEMLKMLAAPDPCRSLSTMEQVGVLAQILPIQGLSVIGPLVALEQQTQTAPDALRRLCALAPIDAQDRLRLSRKATRILSDLDEARNGTFSPKALGFKFGQVRGWDALLLRHAAMGQPIDKLQKHVVEKGSRAVFPVNAADLQPMYEGAMLGQKLRELETRWLASDLTLNRDKLLG